MASYPADLLYAKSHEWVKLEGAVATMGITEFAQSELGDVVYVELPVVGRVVQAGETLAIVESVKTVSDIYAPVAGTVVEVNAALGAQSELVNTDPYGAGYLLKLSVDGTPSVEGLMDAEAYKASVE